MRSEQGEDVGHPGPAHRNDGGTVRHVLGIAGDSRSGDPKTRLSLPLGPSHDRPVKRKFPVQRRFDGQLVPLDPCHSLKTVGQSLPPGPAMNPDFRRTRPARGAAGGSSRTEGIRVFE